jgi:hypothetical protein
MSCTYDKSTDHAQLVRLLRRLEALGPGTYRPITHTPVAHTPVAKPADARTADTKPGWTWSGGSRFDSEWYRLVAQQCRKLKALSSTLRFDEEENNDFRAGLKELVGCLHAAYQNNDFGVSRVAEVKRLWQPLESQLKAFLLRNRLQEEKECAKYILAEMAKYTNHFKR